MKLLRNSLGSLKGFLSKLLNGLIVPHTSVTEVGMYRQAQFLAAAALFLCLILFLQISIAIVTGRLGLGIALVALGVNVLLGYGLSRSKSPQWGSGLLVYGFTLFAFILTSMRIVDPATTLYGMISIAYILGGVLLSLGWQIALVALVLTGSVLLGIMRLVTGINMNMLGGNLVILGVVLIFTSKLRDGIERRRLDQVRQINRQLETTRDDLEKERTHLRENEARTRALLAAIPDMVFELSRDGIFLDFVPSATLEPIMPPKNFLGRSVTEVMPPEIALITLHAIQHALESKQVQTFEYQLSLGDTPHHFEARMAVSQPNAVVVFVRDITERKRSEEVQLASRQIAEAALTQNLADFYRSIHSIISPLIPARNFYITLYDAVNNIFTIPFLVDEFDTKWPSYTPGKGLGAYVLRTGKPLLTTPGTFVDMERQGLVEILGRRMVEWLGVPLKTREGKIIGVMAVQNYSGPPRLGPLHMDLLVFVSVQVAMAIERMQAEAEREKLIQELTAKNAELERFTYTVSHDLKSPLVTISGFLGYLEADISTGNMNRFELDKRRIEEAVDKMRRLLNELLELSRIGRLVNAPEAIPFADLVQDALNVVHGQLEERGVTVAVQPNLPVVYGDRHRLTEVLQNLVDNAVKFMGDQPTPQIEIGQRDKDANTRRDEPVLFVRDNGIGIEPKYHEQVFGLFNKLNPDIEGTGIGLALVKRIIEFHGGRIWVESEAGKGTTFCFTLLPASALAN